MGVKIRKIEIDYDDENHVYSYNGEVIPSVTGLLSPNFYSSKPDSMVLGTNIHTYMGRYLELQEGAHEWLEAEETGKGSKCLEQMKKYLKNYIPKVWESVAGLEFEIDGELYYLGGTADLVALSRGENKISVSDLKTGLAYDWHELQVSIYGLMHDSDNNYLIYPDSVLKVDSWDKKSLVEYVASLLVAKKQGRLHNGKIYSKMSDVTAKKLDELAALKNQEKELKEKFDSLKLEISQGLKEGDKLKNDYCSFFYVNPTTTTKIDISLLSELEKKEYDNLLEKAAVESVRKGYWNLSLKKGSKY